MTSGLQLVSTITSNNTLELSLIEQEVPTPAAKEVIIRIEAAPINPTDLASMLGMADPSTLRTAGTPDSPKTVADMPASLMQLYATRLDRPLPTGTEGAGVVVDAGSSAEAQAMLGKTVCVSTGTQHGQYSCAHISACMVMPEGITPEQAAAAFVNPLTALGFVETMRMEGHKALVNTAAASNLGMMLHRICQADGIDLVNIVRRAEQEQLLRELGAKYVVNSSADSFADDLRDALAETGATIAFDAIGGGELGYDILSSMEQIAAQKMDFYNHYGSNVVKQLYVYGRLDLSPLSIKPGLGFRWSVGGWIMFSFLANAGREVVERLKARVAAEITTTFASQYSHKISLQQALDIANIETYSKMATGEKFLICPQG